MSFELRATALLIGPLLLAGCFVNIDGEMGNASFRMDGGESQDVSGDWGTDRALALGTVMSVRASPNEDLEGPLLQSTNEEVIALRELLTVVPEPIASFEALGTGRAAIELRRSEDNRLIDFFLVEVEEATAASMLRNRRGPMGAEREAVAEEFAVVAGTPVSLSVRLDNENGVQLNHHNVTEASSSDTDILEADAGGSVVLLDANAAGTADLLLTLPGQPASNQFAVTVLLEADVTNLEVRAAQPIVCRENKLLLFADLNSVEGLDVLGEAVDWELVGEDLSGVVGDSSLSVEFEPESVPFTVVASYGDLTASFLLEEEIVCTEESTGCTLVYRSPARGPQQLAGLLLVLLAGRRRERR